MTSPAPFLLRLVSSSVAIANRAGVLIRDVLKKGELGIVNKVLFEAAAETDSKALERFFLQETKLNRL